MPPLGPETKHSAYSGVKAGGKQGVLDVTFLWTPQEKIREKIRGNEIGK